MNTTPYNDLMKIADAAFLSDEIPGHLRPWKSAEQWKYNAPARLIIAREIERALLDRKQQTTAVLAAFGRSDIDAAIARMKAVSVGAIQDAYWKPGPWMKNVRELFIEAARGEESQPAALIAEHTPLTADQWAKRWQAEADARNAQFKELQEWKAKYEKVEADLANAKQLIEALKQAEADSVTRPLPRLRPLAEAGPVPEGAVRVYCYTYQSQRIPTTKPEAASHFADLYQPEEEVKPDPFAELKAAHAAGKVIEILNPAINQDWIEALNPSWDSRFQYRIKPEPATFEAHGKTWTRHTPGDPCPVDGEVMVSVITLEEFDGKTLEDTPRKASHWIWKKMEGYSCDEIIGWRYAELLDRLRDRTESHLLASARDVETIQRQAVLLDRLAGALKAIDDLRNDDFPFGGDFSDKATTAFVGASDALAAYEAAKKGES